MKDLNALARFEASKDLLAVERVQARKRKVLSASRGEEMYTLGKLRHQIKSFLLMSEFRRVKDLLAYMRA